MFTKDVVPMKVNNFTFNIARNRYKKLTDKQKKVLAEYDRHNIVLGNGETTRDNQLKFLIRFGIEIGKDFEDITKDDLIIFLSAKKGGTLEVYREMSTKFFKWINKPELVADLKVIKVEEKLTSDQLWTEDEILKLLKCVDPQPMIAERDQCAVMLLWDLLLERSALVRLNVGDIIDANGRMKIRINGKRRGTVKQVVLEAIDSPIYIRKWLNVHPDSKNPTAPLFVSFSHTNYLKRCDDSYVWFLLKKLQKRSGITKELRPHLLRHSKATNLYRKGFRGIPLMRTLRQSNIQMQMRYAHLCDEDVNDERWEKETGIKRNNGIQKKVLTTITCPKCNEPNLPSSLYCNKCNYALNSNVNTMETMITEIVQKIMKSEFSQLMESELEITKETGEQPNMEVLAVKCQEWLKDSNQPGRKQVQKK